MRLFFALFLVVCVPLRAGVWQDDFEGDALALGWKGDVEAFRLEGGNLVGVSAHPIAILPKSLEVGNDWTNYTATVRVNVVMPNLAICSKGGFVLGKRNGWALVFALHPPASQVEVFEWFTRNEWFASPMLLRYDEWHVLRMDVGVRSARFFVDGVEIGSVKDVDLAGSVGLVVEDTMRTLFDEFRVSGATIPNGGHGEVAAVSPAGRLTTTWARLKR